MSFFHNKLKVFFYMNFMLILLVTSIQKEIDIDKIRFEDNKEEDDCEIPGEEPCKPIGNICLPESVCPNPLSCPIGYVFFNQYTCGLDKELKPESQCPTNHECWDNTCVDDPNKKLSECPTMVSCPTSKNTRCFDNSCVENIEDCPDYFNCPLFLPIRCPNGDCRQSLEDCPSLITCPRAFPVLCNDGSCQVLKSKCQYSSEETQCSDTSMVRCPDGTCTSSKFLCPTIMTCPRGYQKCYNGLCKPRGECYYITDNSTTISTICSDDNKVLCNFDFSCRNDISSCPTGIICPADRPVKCCNMSSR